MPQYVIEREVPGAGSLSEEQLRDVSLRALDAMSGHAIKWLHSYVTDDKIYCVYMAPDSAAVEQHGERAGVPVNRVSAVRALVNSEGISPPEE